MNDDDIPRFRRVNDSISRGSRWLLDLAARTDGSGYVNPKVQDEVRAAHNPPEPSTAETVAAVLTGSLTPEERVVLAKQLVPAEEAQAETEPTPSGNGGARTDQPPPPTAGSADALSLRIAQAERNGDTADAAAAKLQLLALRLDEI